MLKFQPFHKDLERTFLSAFAPPHTPQTLRRKTSRSPLLFKRRKIVQSDWSRGILNLPKEILLESTFKSVVQMPAAFISLSVFSKFDTHVHQQVGVCVFLVDNELDRLAIFLLFSLLWTSKLVSFCLNFVGKSQYVVFFFYEQLHLLGRKVKRGKCRFRQPKGPSFFSTWFSFFP